jgi:hypothetical protein
LNYRTPKGGKYHKESVRRVLAWYTTTWNNTTLREYSSSSG